MGIKFPILSGLLVLLATSSAFPPVAQAETETPPPETISNTFERAYFRHDPNFYENGTLKRQIDSLIGLGRKFGHTFADNEIAKDGELLNTLYHDALAQQTTKDSYLRTPDLPNPYDSSLLMTPRYNGNKLRVGIEYRFKN
ncbi:hypothetical protein MEN41_02150 [Dolichospermum sp. ST_con]|nr:hypothetical protein [Dolichospermum sp. ST_con]MDD1419873.1 hypothetical protein [Dolichospermum sp. ST_sed1]MDD1423975.1 hypothetical protein [Dolichospermum sp. ST_sed9]MDD1430499.1 hypothetical protein [Dolichospermum sp. ST_sed6]MDD1439900.1 hypothetical protein [Dolichospermum sp. ST_sed3]MDD1445689.1 hypothetical protein [Dolichospermum sp. ST_sed8]MDD1454106.1 hypothetical protein [Dolichospermum sp. ST_sed7]MDD1460291.1 hypothetical protein [Dolichospermum sp. ST_sed2]MDD1465542